MGIHGRELWSSDGTAEGTSMVKDIWPGPGSASPGAFLGDFIDVRGVLYFSAEDHTHGRELWRSDGTEEGTFLVKDILPSIASASPRWLAEVNGRLFFFADRELWQLRVALSGDDNGDG